MAKVLGIGGIFFKSADPARLYSWYQKCLGIVVDGDNGATFSPEHMPPDSVTVWSAFKSDTTYFAPSAREFMFNLIVDDVEEALAQVKKEGADVLGTIEDYPYGRFGRFIDPDGNKVELWELPAKKD